ncbi:hypothetical protein S7711_11335 [Stachybotrys chartarum IBT 7711]|uniref:Uncharacterized protein n=1 Tax=Stachybotrys chartarum (strain CBS 109288 / IBT 7711) TaxID=1280523 RepID=A0A084B1W7_STACB|nr:hypothetical protein S7711_11335 [Stachybotrys chartarum IBT 7711]KFA45997.1 hypothetical protein S40293_11368 [Stachybotrys chartarum IBT 40293]
MSSGDMNLSEALNIVPSIHAQRILTVTKDRVEKRRFSGVRLNSEKESLRQFDQVFSNSNHHLGVITKSIHYNVILPLFSEKLLENKPQSNRKAEQNSPIFNEASSSIAPERKSLFDMSEPDPEEIEFRMVEC